MKIRLCFLLRQLNYGGAQRQLIELVRRLDRKKFDICLMTFYEGGRFYEDIRNIPDITYICLGKRHRWDVLLFGARLANEVIRKKPNVLHSYLGGANIWAVFLKVFFPHLKVVWGIRASNMDLSNYDGLVRYAYKMECFLSRFADMIIANSNAGKNDAIRHGFPKNIEVIPNGIDVDRFRPDASARQKIREEWTVKDTDFLIGIVARLDPMKDHSTFLAAASLVASKFSKAKFVCVGTGSTDYTFELRAEAGKYGLDNKIVWAGARNDMPSIYNSLDLLVSSSSYGEGFPNAISEAMACGVPCVVTDVGDSAWIVGDTGVVVPPKNPEALANGWWTMLEKSPDEMASISQRTRQRIVDNFGVKTLVSNTEQCLLSLIKV